MPPTEQVLDEAVHEAVFNAEGADGTAAAFSDGSVPSCTYSGADIKLLVHLPSEETSYALDQIQGLQIENEELYDEQQRASTPATRRNSLNEGIQSNLQRINELMAELSNAQAITKVLSEVQTLSYSIHREKYPVRPLGSVYPKGFCRGPRTISGSMITTVFHRHVFQELIEIMEYRSTGVGAWDRFRWTTGLGDQLPPLDISIRFANEYGNLSWMGIFGVEFVNEGMTMSSEDLFLEGTHTYVARDIDLIRNVANRPLGRNRGVGQILTGEALLQADLNTRLAKRRNTFI